MCVLASLICIRAATQTYETFKTLSISPFTVTWCPPVLYRGSPNCYPDLRHSWKKNALPYIPSDSPFIDQNSVSILLWSFLKFFLGTLEQCHNYQCSIGLFGVGYCWIWLILKRNCGHLFHIWLKPKNIFKVL